MTEKKIPTVGDAVIISDHDDNLYEGKILRVTKTQATVAYDSREDRFLLDGFNRRVGDGDSWQPTRCNFFPTPSDWARFRKHTTEHNIRALAAWYYNKYKALPRDTPEFEAVQKALAALRKLNP